MMKETTLKTRSPWVNFLIGLKKNAHLDLGLKQLTSEWRKMFSIHGLQEDLMAGVTVACIAIPLSLAIALASGVQPAVGLITAIIASIVCALFGGTPLAVSGPAAAMAVLIATVVQEHGLGGLLVVGLICGILQLLTGVFGLGRLVRFIPLPVVAGFTAGIGAIIFIGQLPRALGLPAPDQSHVFDVIAHIVDLFHKTQGSAVILALSTVAIIFAIPRFSRKLPASLIAVAIPSIAVSLLSLKVATIGTIPSSLPSPTFPSLPKEMWDLVGSALTVYILASLETLLSSSAVDKLTKTRHDPDQELIGQGLGNIAASLFGGIPVTGVIARSALNVQAGAKTRRSAIIHGIILLITVYLLAPVMSQIPTAVLAGVLLSVALRMLNPQELIHLWKSSQGDALIYGITFFTIIFVDLIMGVQAGVAAALAIAAIRLGRSKAHLHILKTGSISELTFNGPITFLSSSEMELVRAELETQTLNQGLIINMAKVTSMDASGAMQLIELLDQLKSKNIKFILKNALPECQKNILAQDSEGKLSSTFVSTESEAFRILNGGSTHPLDRLAYGVHKFQKEILSNYRALFEKLAEGQSPHTLFITCSDSRIDPNLITSTEPGELFIVRNVGNIIPAFGEGCTPAEGAAVEFALGVLNINDIIVCGHSGCGAMKELVSDRILSSEFQNHFPSLVKWLKPALDIRSHLPNQATPENAAKTNAILQLENLKTFPMIQERLVRGEIRLHAWFYDIGGAKLEYWDEKQKKFLEIEMKPQRPIQAETDVKLVQKPSTIS